MTISVVQRVSPAQAVTTSVTATLSAATAGNKLIAFMKENGPNAVTTPSGFTHVAGSPFTIGTRQLLCMWKDAAGGETGITFSNADSNNKLLTVWEVSGLKTGAEVYGDTTAQTSANTTKTLDASGTLSQDSNFFIAVAEQSGSNGGSETVNGSWNVRDTGSFDFWIVADQITTATTSLAPQFSWATSRQSGGFMAGFEAAPVEVSADLAVTATIAAAATVTKNISADLDVTATIAAAASKLKTAGATLAVTATFNAQMDRLAAPEAAPPDEFPSVSVWENLGSNVFGLVGSIAFYDSLNFEPRFLEPGQWEMTVPWDDSMSDTITPERYFTVDWRGVRTTWVIEDWSPSSDDQGNKTLVVGGPGALSVLGREQAWPEPSLGLGSQPDIELDPGFLYGPDDAETVIRDLVTDNYVTRAGNDLEFVGGSGSTNLGDTIRARGKWDNLLELVVKKAKRGNLGLDIGLVNTSSTRAELRMRFWEPADRSARVQLSQELGTVSGWEQKNSAPAATMALVSGAGGTKQIVTTPESIAAAAAWGGHRVVYVPLPDSYDADDQTQAGEEALDEGAATTNVSLSATDSEGLQAFTHFTYGDKVKGTLESGLDVVDSITGIKVEVTDSYPHVTATFGDPDATDPLVSMARLTRNHDRRLRQVEQRS